MENKQGCIDWLVEEINKQKAWADPLKLDPIIEQAKAMHKQDVISFAKKCLDKALDLDVRTAYSQVEEMYTETFGGNNE